MRNTRHSKNIGIILYETNMWTSEILPGTKWRKKQIWHLMTRACKHQPLRAHARKDMVHRCVLKKKMRKSTQDANLHIFLWQWRERKDQERKGKEVYLYPLISWENGIRNKYVKTWRMRGTRDTHTTTLCLCLLVKFYVWSSKNTLVLCQNIKIHLLYTYSTLK